MARVASVTHTGKLLWGERVGHISRRKDRAVEMAPWVRNLIMLGVMAVWMPYVAVGLFRHDSISEIVWTVPGAVYFALNPTWRSNGKGKSDDRENPPRS